MSAVRIPAALLALLLALPALDAAAEPFAIRLGAEKIVLDAPPGFMDTLNLGSPRLQDLAESFNSPSNRVLLFGLSDADMRRFQLGDQLQVDRFVMVVTPRAVEQQRLTTDQFAAQAQDWLAGFGKPVTYTDLVKYLESQPIGRSSLLGELRKEPAVVTVLQATRLAPVPGYRFYDSAKPQYLVFATSLLYVHGKALQASVFSLTETAPDIEWMRATSQRWADALRRLNAP